MKLTFGTALILLLMLVFISPSHDTDSQYKRRKKPTMLMAGKALANWYHQRSFPGNSIFMDKISHGFEQSLVNNLRTSNFPGSWTPIGPKNFGGRTLCLAFNPQNPQTIYAGSASGGLWRTYSGGTGAQGWHQVATGFPILGVAAIAINPNDTSEIFIGTGEVYNDLNTGTGFAVRTNRGTYGIGILKTSNGGISWSKSIDWAYDSLKGVQDIIINPLNSTTIFAATTEGTYRSYNSGQTWTLIHNIRMATDLQILPGDTSVVFIAAGNSFSANPGIYRSANGGNSFTKITSGLPPTFSGKAMLDICTGSPNVMYASIAEQLTGLGLFRSDDFGLNWTQVNPFDFQTYQGWFAHDVLVKPSDPEIVLACGVDVFKSDDGGINLLQKSYWYNWDFNAVVVGGSEGPGDYVHADVHRMYHHPLNENIVYLATDGGIFRSLDGGETFEGCNGGYQTQQFYANFSCSSTDSLFAIGGMQDNATAVYEGNDGWRRVIGGDGLSTAVNPADDQIVYGSSQYLNVTKSDDKAQTFIGVGVPGGNGAANTNFAGPYVMSHSSPNTLYAGRTKVYKTTNGAQNWNVTNSNNELDGNAVLVLEVSKTNANLVYAATAPVNVPQVGLFKTTNGGNSWTNVTTGIPNRYIMDIAIDPVDNNKVYIAAGGFGTPHFYRSINGGTTWSAFGSGLPDVPVNTITIDPLNTSVIYLGNDIGIYVSIDGGLNWQPFNDGLIDGVFVMDISISPSNRMLRLATHGKGVYERPMLPVNVTSVSEQLTINDISIFPNPASDFININYTDNIFPDLIFVTDVKGKLIKNLNPSFSKFDIGELSAGLYFLVADFNGKQVKLKFAKM